MDEADKESDLFAQVMVFIRHVERMRHVLAQRTGLIETDVAALGFLRTSGDLGPTELAEIVGITTSATTSLIDRLEQRGLAKRVSHPHDRRRRCVAITDEGRALLDDAAVVFEQAFAAAVTAQTERLAPAMREVNDVLQSIAL